MCGLNPLLLKKEEKLEIEGYLLIMCHCAGGGVYGEGVSAFPTCLNLGIFSVVHCIGVQLVSGCLSDGN